MTCVKKISGGFSLVEMAVVLVIVGLLVGAGFSGMGAFMDNAKQTSTRGDLLLTKQALLNYVKVNKHMPCPDVPGTVNYPDGKEDRTGRTCDAYLGTVPYDDIGSSRAEASDEYNNLFGYAIHKEANDTAIMDDLNIGITSEADLLLLRPGAYFYNLSPPAFDLDTPPTALFPEDDMTKSYQVCKKYAENDCSETGDVEVSYIPAVLIAYNENGNTTGLDDCTGARGEREPENCDTSSDLEPLFIRGKFEDYDFDDQIVTISAYEIKAHALGDFKDPPTASDDYDSESQYDGYDVIIRGDVDSSNDLNVATGEDNSFYIDHDDSGITGGNLNANVQLKDGVDKLKIIGNIEAGGNADMGSGNDDLVVYGTILLRGQATLGDGDDSSTIGGAVIGSIDAGFGNDTVIVEGDVTGTVDMNKGYDDLYLYGDLAGGTLDGGGDGDANGSDTLYTTKSEAAWNQMIADYGGTVIGFDTIIYNHPVP